MKHAVTFREQCVSNAFNFQLIKHFHERESKETDTRSKTKTKSRKDNGNVRADKTRHQHIPVDMDEEETEITLTQLMSDRREIEVMNLLDNARKAENDNVNKPLRDNFLSMLARNIPEEDWTPDQVKPLSIAKIETRTELADDDGFCTGTSSSDCIDGGGDEPMNKTCIETNIYDGEQQETMNGIRQETGANQMHYNSPYTEVDSKNHNTTTNGNQFTPKSTPVKGLIELKCPVCYYRFFLPELYENHLKSCIEYKLVSFAEETIRLSRIRRQTISPHEFIHGMISCLYKMCQWIQLNYNDLFQHTLLITNGYRIGEKLYVNLDLHDNNLMMDYFQPNDVRQYMNAKAKNDNKKNAMINDENNILYVIEKTKKKERNICQPQRIISTSYNASDMKDNQYNIITENKQSSPSHLQYSNGNYSTANSTSFHHVGFTRKGGTFVQQQKQNRPIKMTTAFTARCSPCNITFPTLTEFEIHNAKYHNTFMSQELQRMVEAECVA